MNTPLDALRLTIPQPASAELDAGKMLSVKNWSVGTLLDAIVARGANGQPVVHLLRNGSPLMPALPLPDKTPFKAGDLMLLRVVQTEPRVQLQITPSPSTLTAQNDAKAIKTTLASAMLNPGNEFKPAPPLTPGSKENVANTPNGNAVKSNINTLTIDPKAASEWLDGLSPTLRSMAASNAATITRWQTTPGWSENRAPTLLTTQLEMPIKTPASGRERAQLLLLSLQQLNKTIWPQQRELNESLPKLLPLLRELARLPEHNESTPEWRARVADYAKAVLGSIPRSADLSETIEHDLPRPIKQWLRQWLQHDISDDRSDNNDSDLDAATASRLTSGGNQTDLRDAASRTPLLRLIQALQSTPEIEHNSANDASEQLTNRKPANEPIVDIAGSRKLPDKILQLLTEKNVSDGATDFKELDTLITTVMSRLQQHSIGGVQSEARGQTQWTAELPVFHQNRCDVFDLRIEAEQSQASTIDTGPARYVIRLRFDLPELGPCQFIVQLQGDAINVNVYSEQASTQQKFADAQTTLSQWLAQDALQLNAMECFTISNLTERMR